MAHQKPVGKEFGDFQTPQALVTEVLQCLQATDRPWARVLEPTCGQGNFIAALLTLKDPPHEIQAIELNPDYYQATQHLTQSASSTRIQVQHAKFFDLDLQQLAWQTSGRLLVVGNPPWITNAALGSLESDNLPVKTNLKRLRGIEALTGYSNFDLTECIWLKLIRELASEQPTIALLCKTSVARNILKFASDTQLPISHAAIYKINALKWFGAAVGACLFRLEVGTDSPCYQAAVYPDLQATEPETTIGIFAGTLINNIHTYRPPAWVGEHSSLTWRQGLKHDAASIMELTGNRLEGWQNKLGEPVKVEPDYVFPLLKGSDVFHGKAPHRSVIVPQRRIGERTEPLRQTAPHLWHYLSHHADVFTRRKSSIYQKAPPFSIFGIGQYAFAPYKVGISGLHKHPRFRVIPPVHDRPVMLDDTCYFVPCDSLTQANHLADQLNSPASLDFLHLHIFPDAKRPITKTLLQRIPIDD